LQTAAAVERPRILARFTSVIRQPEGGQMAKRKSATKNKRSMAKRRSAAKKGGATRKGAARKKGATRKQGGRRRKKAPVEDM
jgi:hypothetical protein